jgi:uncharacterized membrane protein YhaH (DUF805 family)
VSRSLEGAGPTGKSAYNPPVSSPVFNGVVDRIRVMVCSIAVLTFAVGLLVFGVVTEHGGRTRFGPTVGADYATFYVAGQALNHHPTQLYDESAQSAAYHRTLPDAPPGNALPYFYPPAVAALFRPLAALPFTSSYLTWLAFSGAMYLVALWLIVGLSPARLHADRWILLLALAAFEPIVIDGWIGGQLSSLGLLLCAAALRLMRDEHWFAAGVALGLCSYKPTLLLFALPVLIIGGRYRVVTGMVAGGGAVVVASLGAAGIGGMRQWVHALGRAASYHSTTGALMFPRWKFVDLSSSLELAGLPRAVAFAALAVAVAAVLALGWRAWRHEPSSAAWEHLAVALALAVPFNGYLALYDVAFVVPALVLAVARIGDRRSPGWWETGLVVAVWALPWFSQPVARATHVQVYTLVLGALGVSLLRRRPSPDDKDVGAADVGAADVGAADVGAQDVGATELSLTRTVQRLSLPDPDGASGPG